MMMMMMMRKSLVFNAYRKYSLSQSILYLDEMELMYTHNQLRGPKHDIRRTVHHIAQRERFFFPILTVASSIPMSKLGNRRPFHVLRCIISICSCEWQHVLFEHTQQHLSYGQPQCFFQSTGSYAIEKAPRQLTDRLSRPDSLGTHGSFAFPPPPSGIISCTQSSSRSHNCEAVPFPLIPLSQTYSSDKPPPAHVS